MIFVVFTFIFLALLLFYVTGEAQPEKFSLQLPVLSLLPSLLLIIFILAYLLSNQKPLELTCSEPATTTDYKNRTPLLETLCIANGMPTPDLYIVDNISINAIAWGRKPDEFRIYLTKGACDLLAEDELETILAQQLGHIFYGDNRLYPFLMMMVILLDMILIWSGVGFFVGMGYLNVGGAYVASSLLASFGNLGNAIGILIFVFIGLLIVMRIFFGRFYGGNLHSKADLFAVRLTKNTSALVQALLKTKRQRPLFHIPLEWRGLAFVHPDPNLPTKWHMDVDERIMHLKEELGTVVFEDKRI